VVVDDVEDHAEAGRVRRVDEAREPGRAAVGGMHGVRVEAVVAPAALAREGRDRHELDRCDTEPAQPAQPRDDSLERPLLAEGADVELVEHEPVEREPRPAGVAPLEGAGVEDPRRSAYALGLPARARIRPVLAVCD
jgi:hypothetical protein